MGLGASRRAGITNYCLMPLKQGTELLHRKISNLKPVNPVQRSLLASPKRNGFSSLTSLYREAWEFLWHSSVDAGLWVLAVQASNRHEAAHGMQVTYAPAVCKDREAG